MYPIVFEHGLFAEEFVLSLVFEPILDFVDGEVDPFGHVLVVESAGVRVLLRGLFFQKE